MNLLLQFGLMIYQSGTLWMVASIRRNENTNALLEKLLARDDIPAAAQITAFLSKQKIKGRLRVIPTAEQYLTQGWIAPASKPD